MKKAFLVSKIREKYMNSKLYFNTSTAEDVVRVHAYTHR